MLCLLRLLGLLVCSTLSLQSKLEFAIQPRSIIVREGTSAILNCQTKVQTSNIYITWKKGEQWIDVLPPGMNKSYSMLSNHSLYFPSVRKSDEDTYMCAAVVPNTSQKNYSIIAHITLAYIHSTFNSNPSSPAQPVREFAEVFFSCISGASQPLANIMWEKDGQPIMNKNIMGQNYIKSSNATSGSLQLKNVSLSDAGYYTCVATNPLLPDLPKKSLKALLLVLPKDDKPRIEVHPVNKVPSPVNRPLQMHCVIVGVPPPVIYWKKDSENVTNSSDSRRQVFFNGTLNFKSLEVKDNGLYSCFGSNDKGTVRSSRVLLRVAYINYRFKQNPQNKTVVTGNKVEMICQPPEHFPSRNIIIKWYKNYRVLTMTSRMKILSTGSLFFERVLKSDQGVYFCEANNNVSYQTRTSTEAYLTVHVPPYFLSRPSNQTVILYEQLSLPCVFSGSPLPSVLWYHDNTLLSNSSTLRIITNKSLTIFQVKPNDGGVYKCFIWNIAGKKSAEANVTVHVPPNATIVPRNTSAVIGNRATFYCQFRGNPPPSVNWLFSRTQSGESVALKNSSRFVQTNTQLHVVNVTEQNKGWFTCVGRNDAGVMNFSAFLNVFVPAYFTKALKNITVNESDTVEMTCGGKGNPEPTLSWWKNGQPLVVDNKTLLNHGSLQLRNVDRSYSGFYSCNIMNKFGNETTTAYLTVQVSPIIHDVIGFTRLKWKTNTSFECWSDGLPKPSIVWWKDGALITYTKRVKPFRTMLIILITNHNDTGNYTCEASNVVGSSKKTKELIVEVPPDHPKDLRLLNRSATVLHILWRPGFDGYSSIVSFRVEIKENMVSGTWKIVSKSVASHTYIVSNLRPYVKYDVRVFAKNNIGWSKPSEEISVVTQQDSPSSPVNLSCMASNATAVHLAWGKPSVSNGVLSQYRIIYKERGNSTEYFVLSSFLQRIVADLHIFTVYDFKIQASTGNNTLWGNYTSFVSCRSGESAPTVAPQNIRLTSLGWNKVLVQWELISPISATGIVRRYLLQYKTIAEKHFTEIIIYGNQTTQLNITGLDPWTEYVVQVAAVTVRRGPWSERGTSRTLESAPSGPPVNITITGDTSHSLMVSWDAPLSDKRHGVITGYMVLYTEDNLNTPTLNITTNETMVYISGLSIFTRYSVQISARTSVGQGPFSRSSKAMTLESYPGLVRDVKTMIINDTILVYWAIPETSNGIITGYNVHYNATVTKTVQILGTNTTTVVITTYTQNAITNITNAVLVGIPGNVTYLICVAARTSVGYGQCTAPITFTTNFSLPLTPTPSIPPGEFTPRIVNDHLPLIAGGTTVLVVIAITLFACFMVRRKRRKYEEEQAKRTYNFRGHAFTMSSYGDGESSVASHGSKPLDGYSEDTAGSLRHHRNSNNAHASTQAEGRDQSPLFRLRNTSIHLGSDASSYDDPYSSIDEIGVDLTPHHAPNKPEHHAAINKLYADLHPDNSAGSNSENTSISSVTLNPIYAPSQVVPQAYLETDDDILHTTRAPNDSNIPPTNLAIINSAQFPEQKEEHFSTNSSDSDPYEDLVLPPPPVLFSDQDVDQYSLPEPYESYTNDDVTDF